MIWTFWLISICIIHRYISHNFLCYSSGYFSHSHLRKQERFYELHNWFTCSWKKIDFHLTCSWAIWYMYIMHSNYSCPSLSFPVPICINLTSSYKLSFLTHGFNFLLCSIVFHLCSLNDHDLELYNETITPLKIMTPPAWLSVSKLLWI